MQLVASFVLEARSILDNGDKFWFKIFRVFYLHLDHFISFSWRRNLRVLIKVVCLYRLNFPWILLSDSIHAFCVACCKVSHERQNSIARFPHA